MSEQFIENVEQTTEETEVQVEQIADESARVYTEEEVQAIKEEYGRKMDKKISRAEAKVRKEYERKYGDLESVLRAGTGKETETVEELTGAFTDFYKSQGVDIQHRPRYADRDIEILARHEADEIIKGGLEEVIEEVDRLAEIGFDNMDARERAMFKQLAEHRKEAEASHELEKLGVGKEVYTSQEFKDFAENFKEGTPINKVYEMYARMQPKKNIQTMGSVVSTHESRVKDYYTPEEIAKLTEADLEDSQVWEAVRRSMTSGR